HAHYSWPASIPAMITSSNLVVRGHSGPTQQRHTGLGCAGFGLRTAFCDLLEAASGCLGSSVVASLADAFTAVGIALSGAVCGELDGDGVPCRLFGTLIVGEAGETIVESKVPGLRGTAAMTDLPSTFASWLAICRTRLLAPAIDPHTTKATTHPAF